MQAQTEALQRYGARLLKWPNVVGVGVGVKTRRMKRTDTKAVVVMVSRKLPEESLQSHEVIPRQLGKDVLTDVIEVGAVKALAPSKEEIAYRHGRQRPALGGISVGHLNVTAGTFGSAVRDARTGEPLILSNNHVLANASAGNDGRARVGDVILQPAIYDGGQQPDDVIGTLKRFVPIHVQAPQATCPRALGIQRGLNALMQILVPDYQIEFRRLGRKDNLVDAAVAEPRDPDAISFDIMGIGELQGTRQPQEGLRVRKSGRSSGLNEGAITVLDASIKVNMGDVGEALFTDQIITDPMANPGDSGSVLVDDENLVVGLLSAGSSRISVSSRIDHVFDLLKITV